MHKLIVVADPMHEVEIYEVTDNNNLHQISQLRLPQESVNFIKNYTDSIKEKVEVVYAGPSDYVQHFVNQVNNFDFVEAHISK